MMVKRNIEPTIQKYSAERLDTTVSMLAEAFVTNPLHISAFGPQRIDQNRSFFRIGLRHMFTGQAFVALGMIKFAATSTLTRRPIASRRRKRFRSLLRPY